MNAKFQKRKISKVCQWCGNKLTFDVTDLVRNARAEGRRDVLTELLSKNWWNDQQRMVLTEWLKGANNDSKRAN